MMTRASSAIAMARLPLRDKRMILKLISAVVPPEAPLRVASVGDADREAMMTNVSAPESTPHENINQYMPAETFPFVSRMITDSSMSMGDKWIGE